MAERDRGRRLKIARWTLRRIARGEECLPFGLDPKEVINKLAEEEPSLEMNGILHETPLTIIRKQVEKEVKLKKI